jgi:CHAT domain-containing protein
MHFAGHSSLTPLGASLELADGPVDIPAILRLGLRPSVTVIAGCASGITGSRQTWGSLAAAFLASGSKAVVGSYRSVRDEDVARFMSEFYAQGGAKSPGRAVARAQRALAARGAPVSAWAPFVLVGLMNNPCRQAL